jgi:hypothetical protein
LKLQADFTTKRAAQAREDRKQKELSGPARRRIHKEDSDCDRKE